MPWKMDASSYEAAIEKGNGIALSEEKRKKLELLDAGCLETLKGCILEHGLEIEQEMQL